MNFFLSLVLLELGFQWCSSSLCLSSDAVTQVGRFSVKVLLFHLSGFVNIFLLNLIIPGVGNCNLGVLCVGRRCSAMFFIPRLPFILKQNWQHHSVVRSAFLTSAVYPLLQYWQSLEHCLLSALHFWWWVNVSSMKWMHWGMGMTSSPKCFFFF